MSYWRFVLGVKWRCLTKKRQTSLLLWWWSVEIRATGSSCFPQSNVGTRGIEASVFSRSLFFSLKLKCTNLDSVASLAFRINRHKAFEGSDQWMDKSNLFQRVRRKPSYEWINWSVMQYRHTQAGASQRALDVTEWGWFARWSFQLVQCVTPTVPAPFHPCTPYSPWQALQ